MDRTAQIRQKSASSGDTTRLDLLAVRRAGSTRQNRLPGLALIAVGAVLLFVLPAALILYQLDAAPGQKGPAVAKEGLRAPNPGQVGPRAAPQWRDLLASGLPLDEPAPVEEPQRGAPDDNGRPGGHGVPFREDGGKDNDPGAFVPPDHPLAPGGEQRPRPPIGPRPPERGGQGHLPAEEGPPQWKLEIQKQMEKRISFDFVDTPLPDVVSFLCNLTGTTIVLDPAAIKDDIPAITLKVGDMRLGAALDWILRVAGLEYALHDEAIFISTRERLQAMTPIRVYDCRQHLDPRAQEELLHLIVQVTGDDWHPPQAIIRFVDGRLVLRHNRLAMAKAAAFMDEFIRASEKAAAKAGKGKEPVLPEQAKATEELRAQERTAVEEHRARERMLAGKEQRELAVDAPRNFEHFRTGYLRFMNERRFDQAAQICALAARTKAVVNAEGEQAITEDELRRLTQDVRQMQELHERAGARLKEFQGQEVVLADGGEMRVLGVDDGRLIGLHDGAKVAVGMDRLRLDQVLKLGLGGEENPKVRAYQEALFAFHYYPPEKAKEALVEAAEQGLDVSFYQKLLPKRLEEAARKPEAEGKAEKREF